jgi:hypothetical protein
MELAVENGAPLALLKRNHSWIAITLFCFRELCDESVEALVDRLH